jgi:hypothetical protein
MRCNRQHALRAGAARSVVASALQCATMHACHRLISDSLGNPALEPKQAAQQCAEASLDQAMPGVRLCQSVGDSARRFALGLYSKSLCSLCALQSNPQGFMPPLYGVLCRRSTGTNWPRSRAIRMRSATSGRCFVVPRSALHCIALHCTAVPAVQ